MKFAPLMLVCLMLLPALALAGDVVNEKQSMQNADVIQAIDQLSEKFGPQMKDYFEARRTQIVIKANITAWVCGIIILICLVGLVIIPIALIRKGDKEVFEFILLPLLVLFVLGLTLDIFTSDALPALISPDAATMTAILETLF